MIDLRLARENLEDDPPYFVGAVPPGAGANWLPEENAPLQVWVPERIMQIIVGAAQAYGAQFPSRLGAWHERSIFNAEQAAWVADEVLFIGQVLNDDLVKEFALAIAHVASQVAHSGGKSALAFEGP